MSCRSVGVPCESTGVHVLDDKGVSVEPKYLTTTVIVTACYLAVFEGES